jgi:hypothetical protein
VVPTTIPVIWYHGANPKDRLIGILISQCVVTVGDLFRSLP